MIVPYYKPFLAIVIHYESWSQVQWVCPWWVPTNGGDPYRRWRDKSRAKSPRSWGLLSWVQHLHCRSCTMYRQQRSCPAGNCDQQNLRWCQFVFDIVSYHIFELLVSFDICVTQLFWAYVSKFRKSILHFSCFDIFLFNCSTSTGCPPQFRLGITFKSVESQVTSMVQSMLENGFKTAEQYAPQSMWDESQASPLILTPRGSKVMWCLTWEVLHEVVLPKSNQCKSFAKNWAPPEYSKLQLLASFNCKSSRIFAISGVANLLWCVKVPSPVGFRS